MIAFAKNFCAMFSFIVVLFVAGLGIGLGPILVMMRLDVPPSYGVPAIILMWCTVGALWFAVSEHIKARASEAEGHERG